jgi:hypothetical protein
VRLLVAIPSRSNFAGLSSVVDHCFVHEDVTDVLVYDNGYPPGDEFDAIEAWGVRVDAHGWPFYRMWNNAWHHAADNGFDAVAILNDDITLYPGGLTIAASRFAEEPHVGIVGLNYDRPVVNGIGQALYRRVSGSFRDRGIGGHAFIVRASTWGVVATIDEGYHLWYGDDELFASMQRAGFALEIAQGVPVDHEASTTSVKYPELMARTGEDAARFASRWG